MLAIVFEFVGGPNDGRTFHGTLGDGSDAERYYLVTAHGTVGYRFKVVSDFAVDTLAEEQLKQDTPHHFQRHYYVVTDRIDETNEVLVRAEYLEGQTGTVTRATAMPVPAAEPHDQALQRYLTKTAQSLVETYSHLWPAADPVSRSLQRNISLHLAHVLMEERFAVFAEAPYPAEDQGTIDLLAIAPSQDWFLACQWLRFPNPEEPRATDDETPQAWARVQSFWLSDRLLIPACKKDLGRLAQHCEHGFIVLGGIHWIADANQDQTLPRSWQSGPNEGLEPPQGANVQASSERSSPKAIRLRQFPGQGTCYLVYRWVELPRVPDRCEK